jgi:catalase-peroxidase
MDTFVPNVRNGCMTRKSVRLSGTHGSGNLSADRREIPGALTNDFFVNLLDFGTKWTGTCVDPIFDSNSELRTLA